jgi:hypothetical protein
MYGPQPMPRGDGFGDEYVDDKRTYVRNEQAGSGVQAGCHGEIIEQQAGKKANAQQH